jgi:hypothetical protein
LCAHEKAGACDAGENEHTDYMDYIAQPGIVHLRAAALEYLRRGMSIIPVAGKRATCSWKQFQERRPRPKELETMIGPSTTGIAVVVGAVSGWLACADFDRMDAYHSWQRRQPGLARTLPTAETARGRHCYFRGEGRTTKFNGGDLKYSGYCVVPPSMHPSGHLYRWLVPFDGDLPTILDTEAAGFEVGTPSNRYSGCTNDSGCTSLSAPLGVLDDRAAFVQAAIGKTLPTGPGRRNRKLFNLVLALKFGGFTFMAAELQGIVRQWLDGAIRAGTKDHDFGKTWAEFHYAWEEAHGGSLTRAKAVGRQVKGSLQDRLMALCEALAGDDRGFFLSYGDAADATGCTKRGAYGAMMQLRDAGRLVLVKRGEPKLGGLATEWRLPG